MIAHSRPQGLHRHTETRLRPNPLLSKVRVYVCQSTHKALTALRQGSMIHVRDELFEREVEAPFHEAYYTHTSTSPNYQILVRACVWAMTCAACSPWRLQCTLNARVLVCGCSCIRRSADKIACRDAQDTQS